jgi:hypothetical protein
MFFLSAKLLLQLLFLGLAFHISFSQSLPRSLRELTRAAFARASFAGHVIKRFDGIVLRTIDSDSVSQSGGNIFSGNNGTFFKWV